MSDDLTKPWLPTWQRSDVRLGLALFALAAVAGLWWLVAQRPDEPLADGLAEAQVGGAVGAVAVEGNTAWLGTGRRLQAADVGNPAEPLLLGQSKALPEAVRAIATWRASVLVAAGVGGLIVFDGRDPARVTEIGRVETTWSVNDVTAADGRAYLAEGARGLRIVDIADPGGPRSLGAIDTPGDSLGVDVADGVAFVADWGTGVRIVDVSDPARPREIGVFDTPGEASDVAVMGHVLCVADRQGGLRVVDVTSPSAPRSLGVLTLGGSAERVVAVADRCLVAALDGGLAVVDVSEPHAPRLLTPLPGVIVATDVAVGRDWVFVADVGAQVRPAQDSRIDLWSRMHMLGVENRPLAAEGPAGLHIAGLGPGGAVPLGLLISPSLIEDAVAHPSSSVVYLADGHTGVIVLDVTEPRSPRAMRIVASGGVAHAVVVDGERLLVADGANGLTVFDIADPLAPRKVTSVALPGEALGVAVRDGLAYVADGTAGLVVVDPAAARIVSTLDTPNFSWSVTVVGHLAYVCDRSGGLRAVDVSDPTSLRPLGVVLEGQGDIVDVAEGAGVLWVAAGPAGVFAVDASDPMALEVLGQVPFEDRAIGVIVQGDRVYVAAGNDGLREIDGSNPSTPVATRRWVLSGSAERLIAMDGLVYVAAEMGGLQIVAP